MSDLIAQELLPPQNLEAERSVLGACLIDPEAIILAQDLLTAESFYRHAHATVYEAMLSLAAQSTRVDLISLSNELERREQLENVGGIDYLVELTEVVPTSANIGHYAAIVRERWERRRMIRIGTQLVQSAHEPSLDHMAAAAGFTQELITLQTERDTGDFVTAPELMKRWAPKIDDGPSRATAYIRTPLSALNRMIGGFADYEVQAWSGPPGGGKTTLSLQCAHALAKGGTPVLYVSMEIGMDRIAERLCAIDSGVPGRVIQRGPREAFDLATPSIINGINSIYGLPHLHFMFGASSTASIAARGKQIIAKWKRKPVIFVDRLEYYADPDIEHWELRKQRTALTKRTKAIATSLNCPVVLLCQQSRAGQQEEVPTMNGFLESGSIENDCQVAIVIRANKEDGTAIFWVVKQNDGPTGPCDEVKYIPKIPAFYDMEKRFG